jgi:hypothetical protein
VPPGQTPVEFSCGNYDQPVAGERGGTAGSLHTNNGEYQYLLLWSRTRLLEEIFPCSMPWHLGATSRFFGGSVNEAPPTHVDLDPVAQLLLTRFPHRVLAASVDRAVRYWSGAGQATYPEAAEAFRADQAAIRKATVVLQKHLRLSDIVNW